jgi:prepilin-type N-terminal cleavage/methylation domain-containing protein
MFGFFGKIPSLISAHLYLQRTHSECIPYVQTMGIRSHCMRLRITSPNRIRAGAGFSLIELLVVCAILALLVGIGINTLAGSKTQGIDQAGNTASGLANLARQHAISMNSLTAMVVADIPNSGQTNAAISIWDVDSSMKATQAERWTMLPATVAATTTNAAVATLSPTGISYQNRPVTPSGIFWFYPDGRVGDGTVTPKLHLAPRVGAQANYYELVFNPVVGTHKINRP